MKELAWSCIKVWTQDSTITATKKFPLKVASLMFILVGFTSVANFQTQKQIESLPSPWRSPSSPQNQTHDHHHCHPWDADTDDWWTHHPEWEVSTENETHYCFAAIHNEKKAELFRQLYEIGFSPNANCSSVITKRMFSSGWGTDIIDVVDGLLHSLKTNQPLQMWVPGMWHYAVLPNGTNPACPRKDMFCYFLNFSHCPPNPEKHITGRIAKRRIYHFGTPSRWLVEYATRPQTWLRREAYHYAATHLMLYRPDYSEGLRAASPVSSFNFSSKNISDNANSSSNRAAEIIRTRVRNEPFPKESCIPIHVRRADVVLHNIHSRKYYPISSYFEALWTRTNYHHPSFSNLTDDERPFILLLTDDKNAIGEALVEYGQFPWMYLDRPRHRGAEGGWENQIPSGDPRIEVIAIEAIRRLVKRCKPPLVYSESSFADHLRSIMEEQLSLSGDNGTQPLHIKLDWYVKDGSKLRHSNNSNTVTISKPFR